MLFADYVILIMIFVLSYIPVDYFFFGKLRQLYSGKYKFLKAIIKAGYPGYSYPFLQEIYKKYNIDFYSYKGSPCGFVINLPTFPPQSYTEQQYQQNQEKRQLVCLELQNKINALNPQDKKTKILKLELQILQDYYRYMY